MTNSIIAALESGTRPWMKPWSAPASDRMPLLPLRGNGTSYRGINVLLLWGEAMDKGFTCNTWMTYKQAEAHKAHVRKGEKGSMVVYADRASTTETNEKGEEVERALRRCSVPQMTLPTRRIDKLPRHGRATDPCCTWRLIQA